MAPLRILDDLGTQLLFYGRTLAWAPRTVSRYKREVVRLLAEVSFGSGALAVVGGTVGVICFLTFFTGTEVRLGVLQHPRDLPAGRRARAVGHGRLWLHRPARRDAYLGGGRRAGGDGGPVVAVPGDDPDDRRFHRRHPAVRGGPALQLSGHPDHCHRLLRTVDRHVRLLLPPLPAPGRRAVVVRQGTGVQPGRGAGALLLRVHRDRQAGWRRCGGRPGGPAGDRRGQRRGLLPLARDLGRDDHGTDRGVSAMVLRRVLGLAFVVVLAAAVALSVLVYRKAFTPATWVTL